MCYLEPMTCTALSDLRLKCHYKQWSAPFLLSPLDQYSYIVHYSAIIRKNIEEDYVV